MALRMKLALAATLLAAASVPAQITTYTEANLGYPVPIPVDSPTPVEGFRTYDALATRHTDLWLAHDHITRVQVGATRSGEPIFAYRFSDADELTVDGVPREGGILVNGTIHAREWASPEILTQFFEMLALDYGTDPIVTWLVDQNRIVLLPVLNIDGFLVTQEFPNQQYASNEGRMRRKNLLNTDGDLFTLQDNLLGVDLNRNFTEGWSSSSSTPSSQTYRGPSPLSEPESNALVNAITLFTDDEQLRCYYDVHGAIPAIYYVLHNKPTIDTHTTGLLTRMQNAYRATNGVPSSYGGIVVNPGGAIGATDEYHGYVHEVPSYTIEYPTPNYRDGGPSGNTFILPMDEVSQVVDENIKAMMLGVMFAAGPPILERVTLWTDDNSNGGIDEGEVAYRAGWAPDGGGRAWSVTTGDGSVPAGRAYNVLLQFDRPMRLFGRSSQVLNWTGQSWPLQPVASIDAPLEAGGTQPVVVAAVGTGWQRNSAGPGSPGFARYAGDTWAGTLDLSAVEPDPETDAVLRVSVRDLYGFELDARPQTAADWLPTAPGRTPGWGGYEDANGAGATGGEDRSFTLRLAAPSTMGTGWQVLGD